MTQTASAPIPAPHTESTTTVLDEPADEHAARTVWAALTRHLAGRHWMRLYVPSPIPGKLGKYDDENRLTWRNLPNRPAAVMIFDGNGKTRVLFMDFDPKPVDDSPEAAAAAIAAVKRDAALLISWVRQLGGVVVVVSSRRGGMHL